MIIDFESGPSTSNREWMERAGHRFKSPEELTAEELPQELWRMIHALAAARVFLESTDRFTDAELYAKLWRDVLPDECVDAGRVPAAAFHWDFTAWEDMESDTPLAPGEEYDEADDPFLDDPKYPPRRDHLLPKAHGKAVEEKNE